MITIPRTLCLAGALSIPALGVLWHQHGLVLAEHTRNAQLWVEVEQTRALVEKTRAENESEAAAMRQRKAEDKRLTTKSASFTGGLHAASATLAFASTAPSAAADRVSLSKTNLNRLHLKPFTDNYRLTDEVAAVLGLSSAERKRVDAVLAHLIEEHNRFDLAKAKQIEAHLCSDPGRKTTFHVPAYAEEGRLLARETVQSLEQAIGEQRSQILTGYADLGSISADGFEPFGRLEKTITFLDSTTEDGQRGECKIFMKVSDPDGGTTLSTSFANQDDRIPANWRHLVQNVAPKP